MTRMRFYTRRQWAAVCGARLLGRVLLFGTLAYLAWAALLTFLVNK